MHLLRSYLADLEHAKRTQKEGKEKEKKKEKERRQKSLNLHRAGEFYFDNTGPELIYTPLSALAQLWRSSRSRVIEEQSNRTNPEHKVEG